MNTPIKIGQIRVWTHVDRHEHLRIVEEGPEPGTYSIWFPIFDTPQIIPNVSAYHILRNSRVVVDMDQELEAL